MQMTWPMATPSERPAKRARQDRSSSPHPRTYLSPYKVTGQASSLLLIRGANGMSRTMPVAGSSNLVAGSDSRTGARTTSNVTPSTASATKGKNKSRSPESYHSLARRSEAANILQSYGMLSWWSFARSESLTQTRLHFQNIVAGFTDEDEASFIQWRTDNSPHPARAAQIASRKGKERVSSGHAGDVAGGRPADAAAARLAGSVSPRARESALANANGSTNASPSGSGKKKRRAG